MLQHLLCIIWCIGYSDALLMYSLYPQDDQETNLLETIGRGSCGSLHTSLYYFTLEKFFSLFKPQH